MYRLQGAKKISRSIPAKNGHLMISFTLVLKLVSSFPNSDIFPSHSMHLSCGTQAEYSKHFCLEMFGAQVKIETVIAHLSFKISDLSSVLSLKIQWERMVYSKTIGNRKQTGISECGSNTTSKDKDCDCGHNKWGGKTLH